MTTINCRNGSFDTDERTLSILKVYKSIATKEDVIRIYGDDLLAPALEYKNLNLFINFLNNPSNELLTSIYIDYLDKMIEGIKAFIDISCEFALEEGEIENILYRYENKNNIEAYKNGQLSSLKSTSIKPFTIKAAFKNDNSVPLAFKAPNFCPYIKIDNIFKESLFSNEAEYIIPPYVNCTLTDKYEEDYRHNDIYRVIHINSDYLDANPEKMVSNYQVYKKYKDSYWRLFYKDKEQGVVSEELRTATKAINQYLKEYAKCKYLKYNELYKNKYNKEKTTTISNWPEEYRGIEEAIIKYCTNEDPDKSWAVSNEDAVYALEELVNSNFIPREDLFKIYESQDKEELDRLLKERNDSSGYNSLSEEEYQNFLNLFNISAGYVEEKATKEERIEATNILACQDFIKERQGSYH